MRQSDTFAAIFFRMLFLKNIISAAIILCLCLPASVTYSQITVTANSNAAALAAALVGPGVTVSNPVLTCANNANGTFTVAPGTTIGTGPTTWGIGTGVILSTGKAIDAAGLESTNASTNNSTAGDPTLTVLAGATTYDACILEFDILPTGDTIKFDYIFGSEEYNHSTCGPYNDAFAFFISGPGIAGTANMALVPGTTIPVTVNSVNSGVPGAGYTLANCTVMGPGSPFTAYFNDNTGGTNFTMKGFTKVLTAMHDVLPCNTYHLKLTIADAGNSIYDSEVFLKQGSISSATTVHSAGICNGSSTTLTGTPAGGTWTSANTAIATVAPSTGYVVGLSAGTVDLTYTTGAGCYSITTLTVNPAPTITGLTSACIGTPVVVNATPTGGTWAGGLAGIATITPAGTATGFAIGTVPITYTDPLGCVSTATFSVFNLTSITGPASVCQGQTIMAGNPATGGTWSSNNTAIATVDATTGAVTGVTAGTAIITYSLGGGCAATENITVLPLPAPPVANGVQYCQGAIATALTAAGSNLLWYTVATGGTGSSTAPIPGTATPGTTTWYVSQTTGGCESHLTPVPVTIEAGPVFHLSGSLFICKHDPNVYVATGLLSPTSTYLWSIPADLSLTPGTTLNSMALNVTADTTGVYEIYLRVIDTLTGCPGYDSALVTVTAPPTAAAFTPQDACLGDTVSLALASHSDNAYNYVWIVDGVSMGVSTALNIVTANSNSGGPFLISWNVPGVHVISVQSYQNGGGCQSDPSFDSVKVHELPDASFSYKAFKSPPCLDDSLYFSARTFDYSYSYQWTPTHSFYYKNASSIWGIVEKTASPVTLTVSDPFGCTSSSTQTIIADACCTISFPSAFTPNNDGKNDFFRPIFTSQGRNIGTSTKPAS